MNLRFVGTCACDYSPLLRTELRDALDLDARRSSCALLDGCLLIDCGDHTPDSLRIQRIPLSAIDTLLLTHLHSDHYNPAHIRAIAQAAPRPLAVAAHESALPALRADLIGANVRLIPLKYLEATEISGYAVTALPANHTACPAHYLIERGGKSLLYATDGAWILYDALYALKGKRLDAAAFDATVGDYTGDFRAGEHNSIPMLRLLLPSLRTIDALRPDTAVYLTHIAPSLHQPHREEAPRLAREGLLLAHDGLTVEI